MTIEKGRPWGVLRPLAIDAAMVASDAQARVIVESARAQGQPVPPFGLLGGDLCRTVGGTGDADRLRSGEAMTLPVDAGRAVVDGREYWFVAHLVARRSWWWGSIVAVMNAQFFGRWDVAPRSHPNDGRLDVVQADAAMTARARWQARSRLITGTHVPHPHITQRRVEEWTVTLVPPMPVWIDGVRVATKASEIAVQCVPDAFTVVV